MVAKVEPTALKVFIVSVVQRGNCPHALAQIFDLNEYARLHAKERAGGNGGVVGGVVPVHE